MFLSFCHLVLEGLFAQLKVYLQLKNWVFNHEDKMSGFGVPLPNLEMHVLFKKQTLKDWVFGKH
jgi:hypothetical protein